MTSQSERASAGMDGLLEIMRDLRDPVHGCPWDLKQDFSTIAPFTLEEAYELVDAIASGDDQQVRDELGDVLFQVVFYSQIADEKGLFDLMMSWKRFPKNWCGDIRTFLITPRESRSLKIR